MKKLNFHLTRYVLYNIVAKQKLPKWKDLFKKKTDTCCSKQTKFWKEFLKWYPNHLDAIQELKQTVGCSTIDFWDDSKYPPKRIKL